MGWLALLSLGLAGCSRPDPETNFQFPKGFLFGVSSALYQIAGNTGVQGGTVRSNWESWERMGKVEGGQRNPFGAGFGQLWAEDIDRMADIGMSVIRLDIEWSRLQPTARGPLDEAELNWLIEILKRLRAKNIKPVLHLYHWVAPAWVQDPETGVDLFAQDTSVFIPAWEQYLRLLIPRLAPYVDEYVGVNEPWSIIVPGYVAGVFPPGKLLDMDGSRQALLNLMYLQASAHRLVKELDTVDADGDGDPASVGVTMAGAYCRPKDVDNEQQQTLAQKCNYILHKDFMRAIAKGDVDLDLDGNSRNTRLTPPERTDPALADSFDWITVNFYRPFFVEPYDLSPTGFTVSGDTRGVNPPVLRDVEGGAIDPEGLAAILDTYGAWGKPLYVDTGTPTAGDGSSMHGKLLLDLSELHRARERGIDIRGHSMWSLTDTFEWQGGFGHMGLFSATPEPPFAREPRPIVDAYRAVIQANGVNSKIWSRYSVEFTKSP